VIVLPFGSDAVVDFESMGAQAPGQAKAENVFDLAASAEISHSGPVELFSRDRHNPDAIVQTNSLVAATHIREALDRDPSRPTDETLFGPFPLPRLLTEEELQPIADFAFTRKISIEARMVIAANQSQSNASDLPNQQADEDNTYLEGAALNVALEMILPSEHVLAGDIFWFAEHFGVNGPMLLVDAVQQNEEDNSKASLLVPDADLGDYIVHAFYYSTEGVQVFSEPFLAAVVVSEEVDIIGIEFIPPDVEALPGDWVRPFVQVSFTDG
jgi:hypothetical protein